MKNAVLKLCKVGIKNPPFVITWQASWCKVDWEGFFYPTFMKYSNNLTYSISKCSRAANSVVGGWVWLKIKFIQAFMVDLVTCKNVEDPFKMKALE